MYIIVLYILYSYCFAKYVSQWWINNLTMLQKLSMAFKSDELTDLGILQYFLTWCNYKLNKMKYSQSCRYVVIIWTIENNLCECVYIRHVTVRKVHMVLIRWPGTVFLWDSKWYGYLFFVFHVTLQYSVWNHTNDGQEDHSLHLNLVGRPLKCNHDMTGIYKNDNQYIKMCAVYL